MDDILMDIIFSDPDLEERINNPPPPIDKRRMSQVKQRLEAVKAQIWSLKGINGTGVGVVNDSPSVIVYMKPFDPVVAQQIRDLLGVDTPVSFEECDIVVV